MSVGTIIHVELLSAHFERSANFYAEVFGWRANEPQAGGHRGLQPPGGPSASWVLEALAQSSGPVAFVGVADLDDALTAVEKAGGRVLVRRQSLGTRGTGALFVDPDGNVMGLLVTSSTPSSDGEKQEGQGDDAEDAEPEDGATDETALEGTGKDATGKDDGHPAKGRPVKVPARKPSTKPRVAAAPKKKKTPAR